MKNLFIIFLFISISSFAQTIDNKPRVFNVMNFGAKHDGTTDDRAAIQNAINAAYNARGGTVYFPNGKYLIHGSLVTSGTDIGNPNSQLYFKYVYSITTDTGSVSIRLLGETAPPPNGSALANYTINNSGVILYSDITGSGTLPSILGSAGTPNLGGYNLITLTVENISFRVKANIGATGPTMSAMNLINVAFADIKNVVCEVDTSSNLTVYPTAETFGIRMPGNGNGAYSAINNVLVTGYKYGVVFGEHANGNNINALVCEHAFVFPPVAPHGYSFNRLGAFWCKYSVTSAIGTMGNTQSSYIDIDQLDVEWQAAGTGNWFDTRYIIYDSVNKLVGDLNYNLVKRAVGHDNSGFTKLGGINLNCQYINGTEYYIPTVTGSFLTAGDLRLKTNGDANGKIYFGTLSAYNQSTDRWGIGTIGPTSKLHVGAVVGSSGGILLDLLSSPNTGSNAYTSMDFNVPTTGLTGQFLATANNYSNAAINLAINSIGLLAEATSGQLAMIAGGSSGYFTINTGGYAAATERLRIIAGGQVGIGVTAPTAMIHLKAGTATASTAPLKFTSGTNLTTAEAGAMEYNGTNLFFSPSTTRYTVDLSLTGSATLDFASLVAIGCEDLTITVTGATDGDVVSLGVPNGSVVANSSYSAWVSATNTVTVRFCALVSGDPASGTFKVRVIKP